MKRIIPGAEPFAFPGGKTGCLLIHGFTATPASMRPLGVFLSKAGYTVFGPRLSGHASVLEDMNRARYEDWIVDIQSAYLMLKDQCETIVTVGQSMGGCLALIAASHWDVAGVVGLAVPAKLPPDPRLPYVRLLSYIKPSFPKSRRRRSSWVDKEAASGHISYEAYPTRAVHELDLLISEMFVRLPNVQVPVLILQSKLDHYAPPEDARRIADTLPSGQVELEILEESGHILTRDAQHEEVFQRVQQFLRQIVGQTSRPA